MERSLVALTDAEFDALQAKLKRESAAKERLPEGTPMNYLAASSAVDDHSMYVYRRKIRQLLGIEGQQMLRPPSTKQHTGYLVLAFERNPNAMVEHGAAHR